MTNDEIIRLAREAGDDWDHTLPTDREFLLRFGALVAAAAEAAEPEACAKVAAEPVNLLRLGLAHALRGIADGFDARRPWWRPWSRPDPLIMRTLRRAADELDKEDV